MIFANVKQKLRNSGTAFVEEENKLYILNIQDSLVYIDADGVLRIKVVGLVNDQIREEREQRIFNNILNILQ